MGANVESGEPGEITEEQIREDDKLLDESSKVQNSDPDDPRARFARLMRGLAKGDNQTTESSGEKEQ